MVTQLKAIVPKPINDEVLLESLRDTVEETIIEADKKFAKTYRTWRNEPSFEQNFKESSTQIEGSTETTGDGSSDNPYPFVARGTSVRYAIMTPDFVAKTTPRIVDSKTGKGGVAFIDRRKPRPGIEAREFEEEIAKAERPEFRKRIRSNLDKARKKSGHAI